MGISYLLDIVIGLFFIYLILSLLASELQELITTILQWRAIHVKESIEGLLSGNETQTESKELAEKSRLLANEIYGNPLIKDCNQEAKGFLTKFKNDVFGKPKNSVFGDDRRSGPSSINKQVFASSFLETLQIPFFTKEFIKLRLNSFVDKKLGEYEKKYLPKKEDLEEKKNLKKKVDQFNTKKVETLKFYDSEKFDLVNILDMLATESNNIDVDLFNTIFEDTYQSINNITVSSTHRREVLVREITPTVLETISLILLYKRIGETCKEIVNDSAVDARKEIVNDAAVKEDEKTVNDESVKGRETNKIMYELIKQKYNSPDFISNYFGYLKDQESYMVEYISKWLKFYAALKSNPVITDEISELVKKIPEIPKPLQKSLEDLAKRSQVKIEEVEIQLSKFQAEIEDWFDRSMIRASGVYKRNAKLVAFMIGFTIAITTNADTLHIVDRLAKDQVLRESVNRSVDQIVTKSVDSKGELTPETKAKIKTISDQISLPIGWSKDNIYPRESIEIFGFLYINPWILRVFGWVISGIAISMGASFWYDLLGKFIDIKNVGKKAPSSSSDNSNSSNQN